MNKIIVDRENIREITDQNIFIDIRVKKLLLKIKGNVVINEIGIKENEELELTIEVDDDSTLVYNRFMKYGTMKNKIMIKQSSMSNVKFNYSFISNDNCDLVINSVIDGNNNCEDINIKAVSILKGKISVNGTAEGKEKTTSNTLNEKIKILLLNDQENICRPNLVVKSNEIEVNHAATISGVDKDSLFYLTSKGIKNDDAIELMKRGFLLENLILDDEVNSEIKKLI